MPEIIKKLPHGLEVRVLYLSEWPNIGNFLYLQSIRSGGIKECSSIAILYKSMIPKYCFQLSNCIEATGIKFDTLVSMPSSRADVDPYKKELVRRFVVKDISTRFAKNPSIKAANPDTSAAELFSNIEYETGNDESSFRSLLIMDDSLASGKSVEAIVQKLKAAGLQDSCVVTVAVPALLSKDST